MTDMRERHMPLSFKEGGLMSVVCLSPPDGDGGDLVPWNPLPSGKLRAPHRLVTRNELGFGMALERSLVSLSMSVCCMFE